MTNGVKPWTFARAAFHVKPLPKGAIRDRRQRLKADKQLLSTGLARAPYVDVEVEGMTTRAMVDTGADWSLLDAGMLTAEELQHISDCSLTGQGVGGEQISILGEVWRDVTAGGLTIPDQRFVVVKRMVTKVILGADFWVRLGEMTLNFRDRKLSVEHLGLMLDLFDSDEERAAADEQAGAVARVKMAHSVEVPPHSELLVEGRIDKVAEKATVLIEPSCENGEMYSVPYTVSRVEDRNVLFKVANVSDKPVNLEKDEDIAYATTQVDVLGPVNRLKESGAAVRQVGKPPDTIKYGSNLTSAQRVELEDLVGSYNDVFYCGGELPLVRVGVEHRIRLNDEYGPVAFQPRRLSKTAETEVREEVEALSNMGVIRPSDSPWAAPIVCARRPDGSLRLAIDYRALNRISLPATLHPIPRIDDLMDRLVGAQYFAVLDAKCGYHQMPLSDDEAVMTAFVVP